MTRKIKSCKNCGYLGHNESECWYGRYESVSLKRILKAIFWLVALAFLAGAIFGLLSCSPATPIYGPHDCESAGIHKHVPDTSGFNSKAIAGERGKN